MSLAVGTPMPDVELVGEDGRVRLRERLGRTLVVYFYPGDEQLGCTWQACGFRDQYAEFERAGASVIGVSKDSLDSHERFRSRYALQFELLSDPGGRVGRAWGVRDLSILGGRSTFVFDGAGILRYRFDSLLRFTRHVEEALKTVREL